MYEAEIEYPFFQMADLYQSPNVESENWKIRTFELDATKDWYTIIENGIPAGKYVALTAKDADKMNMSQNCMMSDTPMEMFTNQNFLNWATGDVLIAGLGIGMLPAALAQKDDVTSITIIELSDEIIGLTEPLIRKFVPNQEKIKIVQADAYNYPKVCTDVKYDWVWLDIWENFPDSDMADELSAFQESYMCICPSTRVLYWGYEFVQAGCDDSPIEVDAFNDYLEELMLNRRLSRLVHDDEYREKELEKILSINIDEAEEFVINDKIIKI